MGLKKELLYESIRRGFRYFLLNILKLAGWKLYIIMKIFDVLWISVIAPFIKKEERKNKWINSSKKSKIMIDHIKKTTHKDNFASKMGDMLKTLRGKDV